MEINRDAVERMAKKAVHDKVEVPLNRVLSDVEKRMAGKPVDEVESELRRRLRREVPALNVKRAKVREWAEQIAVKS